jgi:hypothetical protein
MTNRPKHKAGVEVNDSVIEHDEEMPEWADKMRRRSRLALAVAIAALLLGPVAGFATAEALNKPGPAGPVGARGPQGTPGRAASMGEIDTAVSQQAAILNSRISNLEQERQDSCFLPVSVVRGATIIDNGIGQPILNLQTVDVCPAVP